MMRSLFAGVSGLQNHQTRMDVVGNNIANVNTYGFKRGRVTFKDMISQSLSGAAKPQEDRGGINPQQVGLGMMVATIDTIHTQGALQVTGVNTDLAIQGEGFFIEKRGNNSYYTRNGAFSLDKDGYLVNPSNGYKVQGWNAVLNPETGEMDLNTAAGVEDIIIPVGSKDPARATANTNFFCNLQKSGETHQSDLTIYDSTGIPRQLRATFTRTDVNRWDMVIDVPDATEGSVSVSAGDPVQGGGNNTFQLVFNDAGSLISVSDGTNTQTEGVLMPNVSFTYQGTEGEVNQTINLTMGEVGLFNGITQFESPSTTKAIEQDGYTMGMLEGFSFDDSGQITGVFTNGNRKTLGQVALAKFNNAGGLEKAGDTLFVQSNNSGAANIGVASAEGRGSIKAGTLEMSNVDLSEQFTDMIVTQRGFQSNARTITTADQMLQEVIALKR
ncbi:flagellar hook protein FlgE [uncultured Brachyspira sp.]|uniref:flagellar hook protein FlgE n=1 Tax=uncultured Brachyspira sp. TaxID=221953 RepID=UPI002620F1A5|nr:flagellar hook protein FlgE [uncultured Brachyspira sp.]